MSNNNNKSFLDEIQERYEIELSSYNPLNHCEPGLYVVLKQIQREVVCTNCKSGSGIVHDYKSKVIKEGTMNGVPIFVILNHCRCLCKKCKHTFMEPFEFLAPHKGISAEAENYILAELGILSFSDIARQVGVCIQTIVNRAKEYVQSERKIQLGNRYKYLSMDEVFISRNQYLVDPADCLIDVLRNKKSGAAMTYNMAKKKGIHSIEINPDTGEIFR